jgi:hypothetical protein
MSSVNLKTRSGNRVLITFDTKVIGLIQSIRASDDYAPEPASGIGDIHVVEYVPTQARHTLSCEYMVLNQGSMEAAGIAAENGDAMLQGLVFDILIVSKDDGSLIRKYSGCSYASGDLTVQKHAIVAASCVFNCLDVRGTGA